MFNTEKRDDRRAKKALLENLLSEHHMIANMKEEIAQLKDELKRSHADQEEADKNKGILASLYDKQVIDEHGNLK